MARALFGLLVVAALGVTGYYTYSYVHNDGHCCGSDSTATVIKKSCCSEAGECTSACGLGEGKSEAKKSCCEGKEGTCTEAKEGTCCKEKKDEEKKEEKKDDGKKE